MAAFFLSERDIVYFLNALLPSLSPATNGDCQDDNKTYSMMLMWLWCGWLTGCASKPGRVANSRLHRKRNRAARPSHPARRMSAAR